jgi:hypothetical protein
MPPRQLSYCKLGYSILSLFPFRPIRRNLARVAT